MKYIETFKRHFIGLVDDLVICNLAQHFLGIFKLFYCITILGTMVTLAKYFRENLLLFTAVTLLYCVTAVNRRRFSQKYFARVTIVPKIVMQ